MTSLRHDRQNIVKFLNQEDTDPHFKVLCWRAVKRTRQTQLLLLQPVRPEEFLQLTGDSKDHGLLHLPTVPTAVFLCTTTHTLLLLPQYKLKTCITHSQLPPFWSTDKILCFCFYTFNSIGLGMCPSSLKCTWPFMPIHIFYSLN